MRNSFAMAVKAVHLATALAVSCASPGICGGNQPEPPKGAPAVQEAKAEAEGDRRTKRNDPRYILGPDDQVTVWGIDIEEISGRAAQVDARGDINIPLIGRVRAAGATIPELEKELSDRLRTYVQEPHIVVTVTEYRSQPVSVLGAVNSPGSHQLRGRKTVAEVLAMAGGLKTDAGTWLKLTRREDQGTIPHPSAQTDPSGEFSYANLNLLSITDAKNQTDNIIVRPYDILAIPRADMVYVVGDVQKSGGFVLNEREQMSVLQVVSMAGGLLPTAAGAKAKILRTHGSGGARQEIPVDISKVISGKTSDIPLAAEDILVVPGSKVKKAANRTVEAAVQAITGMAIWRAGR